MKHMTLAEFIETESGEPVFIVDGPQPIVGTACIGTATEWAERIYGGQAGGSMRAAVLAEHDHPFIKANPVY